MSKEKFELEYGLNTSPRIIYNRLSTASGLSEWFADEVSVNGDVFVFNWEGSIQEATVLKKKDKELVRFKWVDDEEDESYFEFKLRKDELTGDMALIITDFADPEDVEDSKELWNTQIETLKHNLGL